MDLSGLMGGLIVIARFRGLLLEFVPHVQEIGKCLGYVVGNVVALDDADHTTTLRIVLSPSLVKDPLQFVSASR